MHIGQSEVSALELEGQSFVIDPEEMHPSGLQIVNVNAVLDGVQSKLIGCTKGHSGLDATARHPDRECVRVMISTPANAIVEVTL